MTPRIDPALALSPQQKANLIYAQAQSEMRQSLWRAALADGDRQNSINAPIPNIFGAPDTPQRTDLSALLDALGIGKGDGEVEPRSPIDPIPILSNRRGDNPAPAPTRNDGTPPDPTSLAHLGANAPLGPALMQAGERTGLPPAALAAIIDAEAAKAPGGAWNPYSRNPRSSAAGLGQFLSGTWIGMAQQSGNWLHAHARAQGWLSAAGKVRGEARSALLALRYDPVASIETIADYSRDNVMRLRAAGVPIANDVRALADAAYVGHHLGPGDALRFYRGTMDAGRARELLGAQIGEVRASHHIARQGDAIAAHRLWLTSYISGAIRPERFLGSDPA